MKPPKKPATDDGCATCPQVAPGDLAAESSPVKAEQEDCHCVKWKVRVTATSIKYRSFTLYQGNELELCEEKADAMVAGGDAVKLHKIY